MLTVEPLTRSGQQAVERKFWVLEATYWLEALGNYPASDHALAVAHAKRLASLYTDEGGDIYESPEDAVRDDLSYEPS